MGKSLGGGSTINFMAYVRGNPADFDHWEKSGATGWSYEDVLPYGSTITIIAITINALTSSITITAMTFFITIIAMTFFITIIAVRVQHHHRRLHLHHLHHAPLRPLRMLVSVFGHVAREYKADPGSIFSIAILHLHFCFTHPSFTLTSALLLSGTLQILQKGREQRRVPAQQVPRDRGSPACL